MLVWEGTCNNCDAQICPLIDEMVMLTFSSGGTHRHYVFFWCFQCDLNDYEIAEPEEAAWLIDQGIVYLRYSWDERTEALVEALCELDHETRLGQLVEPFTFVHRDLMRLHLLDDRGLAASLEILAENMRTDP